MPMHTGRALLDATKILKEAGLSEEQTYIDFGCGTLGHFVIPAARLVGTKGIVYAFDVLPNALVAINERARTERILPLETVWGDLQHERGTEKIPAVSIDLASVINTATLFFKNHIVIKNISRVLKNSGRLLVLDWQKNSPLAKIMSVNTTDPDELKKVIENSGFCLIKKIKVGTNHFGFLFEKIK